MTLKKLFEILTQRKDRGTRNGGSDHNPCIWDMEEDRIQYWPAQELLSEFKIRQGSKKRTKKKQKNGRESSFDNIHMYIQTKK